jgi:hypothetical protein
MGVSRNSQSYIELLEAAEESLRSSEAALIDLREHVHEHQCAARALASSVTTS